MKPPADSPSLACWFDSVEERGYGGHENQRAAATWHCFSASETLALANLFKLQKNSMLVICWRA
jgi:hypothetical protein